MAQHTMVQTQLGDALRRLADRVDGAPALAGAKKYPTVPAQIDFTVRTRDVVAVLAQDFGAPVHTHHGEQGLRSFFDVDCGGVVLHVFAFEGSV
ncbi:hypothetical protein [Microbacterium sp. UBA3394]|uniref:hypothetical protein n=1 Tax=Microbacterium sp. UBA3394 TaxID=1946945 RepID=UPI00257C2F17|nr:hypothetical protein [Microbacterium sp. UBA3394]